MAPTKPQATTKNEWKQNKRKQNKSLQNKQNKINARVRRESEL